jgi:hypothetical protein
MKTTIHLNGLADVLTVLPYQLGFHPQSCLVAVSLRGTRMGLVQRIDLPPPEHVSDAVAAMITPLRRDRPRAMLLIGYEEREGDSRAMLDEMAAACRARGINVADRVAVRDSRWFDLDCSQRCCPPEGRPLPPPSAVPAVAEFVGREICPLPNRSALADLMGPNRSLTSSDLGEVTRLAERWLDRRLRATVAGEKTRTLSARDKGLVDFRAAELALWGRVLRADDEAEPIQALTPRDLAMLAVSLTDVDLRDALIAWLCPGVLPEDVMDRTMTVQMGQVLSEPPWLGGDEPEMLGVIGQQRVERRLCDLSAALPDPLAVSTLTVLASFAWWRGDGALTRVALDRALRVDPHYRLAQLLERMVDLAIRPEGVPA